MSRFFKSAAFPILIVVVLAFFAQKLISPGEQKKDPNYSEFVTQVDNGQVKKVTLNTKNNRIDVEQRNGDRSTRPPIRTTPSRTWSTRCRPPTSPIDVKAQGRQRLARRRSPTSCRS